MKNGKCGPLLSGRLYIYSDMLGIYIQICLEIGVFEII